MKESKAQIPRPNLKLVSHFVFVFAHVINIEFKNFALVISENVSKYKCIAASMLSQVSRSLAG